MWNFSGRLRSLSVCHSMDMCTVFNDYTDGVFNVPMHGEMKTHVHPLFNAVIWRRYHFDAGAIVDAVVAAVVVFVIHVEMNTVK